MDKNTVSLVPYKSYLAPKNATHKKVHVIIPNAFGFEGKATVAITKEAFWIVASSGKYQHVSFKSIRDIKVDQFPGIVYMEEVDGLPTYIAPNDTAGVTIEFNVRGRIPARISYLTHLPNEAYEWVRILTGAIHDYYSRNDPNEESEDTEE